MLWLCNVFLTSSNNWCVVLARKYFTSLVNLMWFCYGTYNVSLKYARCTWRSSLWSPRFKAQCTVCYRYCLVTSRTHLKPSRTVAYADTWIYPACDLSPAQYKRGRAEEHSSHGDGSPQGIPAGCQPETVWTPYTSLDVLGMPDQ